NSLRYTKWDSGLDCRGLETGGEMTDALVAKGVQIKEEMFGPEHGQAKMDRATDFTREFEELVARYCFADVWGREQLPRDLRSMITIAMLVAQGRSHE